MAKVSNDVSRFGGEFMIQDRDHMSGVRQSTDSATRGSVSKSDAGSRQHGRGARSTAKPQGDRRRH